MDFELRAGGTLAGISVFCAHVGRHVRQMNRFYVLLHVLLNLVVGEVFKSAVVERLLLLLGVFKHQTLPAKRLSRLSLTFDRLHLCLTIFVNCLKTRVVSVVSESFC